MALTLDGTTPMPNFGGNSGAGLGVGGGVLGGLLAGGLGGALAGGLFGNRGGNGNGWGGNGNGYGYAPSPAATAVATDVVLNPAFQSLQNQIESVSSQVVQNGVNNAISDVERSVANTSAGLQGSIANLSTAQATQNFTTLQSINSLGRDVQAQSNQNALQQLNSFNQMNTTTLQGFNQAAFNQNIATQQIIAQGVATASAMAQCCCEIKEKIGVDGNLTRQLINDLNVQNLRDQLAAANNQVSNFQQNQFLIDRIRPNVVV